MAEKAELNWTQTQKPKAEVAQCLTMFIDLALVELDSSWKQWESYGTRKQGK